MTIAPPENLGADARAFWRTMVTDFTFEAHELKVLECACRCLDEADRADALVEGEGAMIGVSRAPCPHPLLKHARDSRLAFAALLKQLKLDKAAPAPRPVGLMANRRMISARP